MTSRTLVEPSTADLAATPGEPASDLEPIPQAIPDPGCRERPLTGAGWVVERLRAHGIDTVYGYPGGAIMPVYDALYDADITHVLTRHEQGAALAALGHARSTGQVGVCLSTSGPGATNLLTGLADALLDSVPVVAITGQVASSLIGTDAFQEVDVLGLSLACTKHSYLVTDVADLPRIIDEAFEIARSGRPGPVLVDIAKDVQLAPVGPDAGAPETPVEHAVAPLGPPDAEALAAARALLQAARRPVLYLGGGIVQARATEQVRDLVAVSGIPTTVTAKALGVVAADGDLHLGMLGMHGNRAANELVQACDLVVAIGARFDDRVTGKVSDFAPRARVVHLDIDPAEVGKIRQPDVTLLGDLRTLVPALSVRPDIDPWREEARTAIATHRWRYDHPGEHIYAPALLRELSERMPRNTVVTTDVGQHQMWACQHMGVDHPDNFLTSGGLGTMGFGLPAAVGAQLARPADTVVCVSGDGSILMNIQELATVRRYGLPVKIVLLDNQRLGMVRQWQDLFFDGRRSETVLDDNPDFVALAAAFGVAGRRINRKDEVSEAIAQLLDSPTAFLLHVEIDAEENLWPLVPPGAANDEMLEERC